MTREETGEAVRDEVGWWEEGFVTMSTNRNHSTYVSN
jgi:hypothetical protein